MRFIHFLVFETQNDPNLAEIPPGEKFLLRGDHVTLYYKTESGAITYAPGPPGSPQPRF